MPATPEQRKRRRFPAPPVRSRPSGPPHPPRAIFADAGPTGCGRSRGGWRGSDGDTGNESPRHTKPLARAKGLAAQLLGRSQEAAILQSVWSGPVSEPLQVARPSWSGQTLTGRTIALTPITVDPSTIRQWDLVQPSAKSCGRGEVALSDR